MKKFKIAVCQLKPKRDKYVSVKLALEMLDEAVNNGAELLMLPEIFYHPYELRAIPKLEEANGGTLAKLAEFAKSRKIYLCTGSMVEKQGENRYNQAYLLGPDGKVLLDHRKCHLFDVNFKNLRVRESNFFTPGNEFNVADTQLGKIGMLVCYDIRFPEAARKLAKQGVEIILAPAAFNTITGPAHWELFCRTRAVENQAYLAAASPARDTDAAYHAYGHSMIVDPWGNVLAEAGEGQEIIYSQIDPEFMAETRAKLPMLKHRREEIY